MTDYELYHHGIKGQKWGVRRTAAQLGRRVAGTAKSAGKATGKAIGKTASKAKKAAVKAIKQHVKDTREKAHYKKLHKKKLSQMTDKEIKELTERVNREANLKGAKYESRARNARSFYKTVAQQPINEFAKAYGKELGKEMGKVAAGGKDN